MNVLPIQRTMKAAEPILTRHASQRCASMRVERSRVNAILAQPTMTYAARDDGQVAWSAADPDIAVIYRQDNGRTVVLTVVPRTYERYERSA